MRFRAECPGRRPTAGQPIWQPRRPGRKQHRKSDWAASLDALGRLRDFPLLTAASIDEPLRPAVFRQTSNCGLNQRFSFRVAVKTAMPTVRRVASCEESRESRCSSLRQHFTIRLASQESGTELDSLAKRPTLWSTARVLHKKSNIERRVFRPEVRDAGRRSGKGGQS